MKISTFFLLASLMLTITAPFTLHISPADNITVLVTLDVCHASNAAISVNGETPAVQQSIFILALYSLTEYYDAANFPTKPSVVISQKDRPPKA